VSSATRNFHRALMSSFFYLLKSLLFLMGLGASSFSNRRWNNEQGLSSLYTSKSLDLGDHTSQIIQFREFHKDYRIDCSCHCFGCLDAGDSERSFCNVPNFVGFCVDKNISLQIASLDLFNDACFRIKSLAVAGHSVSHGDFRWTLTRAGRATSEKWRAPVQQWGLVFCG